MHEKLYQPKPGEFGERGTNSFQDEVLLRAVQSGREWPSNMKEILTTVFSSLMDKELAHKHAFWLTQQFRVESDKHPKTLMTLLAVGSALQEAIFQFAADGQKVLGSVPPGLMTVLGGLIGIMAVRVNSRDLDKYDSPHVWPKKISS